MKTVPKFKNTEKIMKRLARKEFERKRANDRAQRRLRHVGIETLLMWGKTSLMGRGSL